MELKRVFICFVVLSIIILLTVGNVGARTNKIVIEPTRELTVNSPSLTPADKIIGNISVQGGFVDFYISSPTGKTVFCRNRTTYTSFNIAALDIGNYTFHFLNSFLLENLTVVLNYKLEFNRAFKENVGVNSSVGTVTVLPLGPRPDFPDDSYETESEKLHRKYLSFREVNDILQMIRDIEMYMPVRSFLGIVEMVGLTLFFGISVSRRRIIDRKLHLLPTYGTVNDENIDAEKIFFTLR